jgi:hypothetical protein
MKAVTYHGKRDVRVDTVPDPTIEQPTDAIIRITSTGICGSDLHLYEVMGAFMDAGDILGHEPMGIVEEVGAEVTQIKPGDRVVIPFNISCGHCFMCDQMLFSQCETTQVREQEKGAALLGYTKLYGQVPGGQAEFLRVPQAHFGPIKVLEGPADDRFVYLSDVLPTAWQAVQYAPDRRQRSGRRRGDAPRADRRSRSRLRDRCRGDGGARIPTRQARPPVGRLAAGRDHPAGDGEGGDRPPERPARHGGRRTQGRHNLAERGVRRDGRPNADDGPVRQADSAADGSGQPSSAGSRRSCLCSRAKTTRSTSTDWPATISRSTRLRTLTRSPEEARRRDQDPAPALADASAGGRHSPVARLLPEYGSCVGWPALASCPPTARLRRVKGRRP